MTTKQVKSKFLGLEAFRGIAAILVVFFHAAVMMNLPKYYGKTPLNGFFGFGHAGVDFFFGTASYSIYLIHFLALSVLIKLFIEFDFETYFSLTVIYFILIICSTAMGVLLHLYVERPVLKWSRAWFMKA